MWWRQTAAGRRGEVCPSAVACRVAGGARAIVTLAEGHHGTKRIVTSIHSTFQEVGKNRGDRDPPCYQEGCAAVCNRHHGTGLKRLRNFFANLHRLDWNGQNISNSHHGSSNNTTTTINSDDRSFD